MVIANVFGVLGMLCINISLAYGKGGAAQALVQTQSPFQLIFEVVIFSKMPNLIGVSGMACAIAGVLVIIFMKP